MKGHNERGMSSRKPVNSALKIFALCPWITHWLLHWLEPALLLVVCFIVSHFFLCPVVQKQKKSFIMTMLSCHLVYIYLRAHLAEFCHTASLFFSRSAQWLVQPYLRHKNYSISMILVNVCKTFRLPSIWKMQLLLLYPPGKKYLDSITIWTDASALTSVEADGTRPFV